MQLSRAALAALSAVLLVIANAVQLSTASMEATFTTGDNITVYATPIVVQINETASADELVSTVRSVSISTRIIGGVTVDATDREWMVALLMYNQSSSSATLCGGNYVGSSGNYHFIVTAAHCLVDTFDTAIAYFNLDNLERANSGYYYLKSYSSKVVNADYDSSTITNDIGIITFKSSSFSGPTPAVLATPEIDLVVGENVTVTGYGLTSYATQSDDYSLREVTLSLLSNATCKSDFAKVGVPTDLDVEVCAMADDKGACSGDSGGPLIVTRGDYEIVIGLVSWGVECADTAAYPDVYTRVSTYVDWIKTNVASVAGTSSFLTFYNSTTMSSDSDSDSSSDSDADSDEYTDSSYTESNSSTSSPSASIAESTSDNAPSPASKLGEGSLGLAVAALLFFSAHL